MGKSVHESMIINNSKSITYAECCKQYLYELNHVDKLTMICLKCSHHLQRIYSLHNDAEELTKQMRQTLSKTKRLNRIRSSNSDDITIIAIKKEPSIVSKPIECNVPNNNHHSKQENFSHHVNNLSDISINFL